MDDYDIVFVPAVFAPKLHGRTYDLFLNTASMGEMNNETIRRWMDFIQHKVKIKNLYTMNRFLNVVDSGHATFRINENEASVSYDHRWDINYWKLEETFALCPYMDTLHSRYVVIIASRPDEEPKDLVEKSKNLLQDVKDEDWVRLKGMFGNGVMQQRANLLSPDLTMTGTLFKLWESLRLDQTAEGAGLMLEYLDTITVGCSRKFEEKMFYEELYNRLKGK